MSEPDLAYEQGLADERAAIVAYLRERNIVVSAFSAADDIERGEHNE